MAGLSEDQLIARLLRPLATAPGAAALTDDAAVLPPIAGDWVVTTDTLVAGVHFFPDDPPDLIARKALRVNLSDLAAKGAAPRGYTLNLALPRAWPDMLGEPWMVSFCAGLAEDQALFAMPLYGGDTVATPGPLTITVTAFGEAPRRRIVRRAGARAGEVVHVTGTIGDGALGLLARTDERAGTCERLGSLSPDDRAALVDRYLLPRPRTVLAPAVSAWATAGMDVSDGLIGDLAKLVAASGVGARLSTDAVPLSRAAARAVALAPALKARALTGGDDYELLIVLPGSHEAGWVAACADAGVPTTRIATTTAGGGLHDTDGAPFDSTMPATGFDHFRT